MIIQEKLMNTIRIESANGGFDIIRDGKKTQWKISIESMVPVKKRSTIEHYYIIVRKKEKIIDRVLYIDLSVIST